MKKVVVFLVIWAGLGMMVNGTIIRPVNIEQMTTDAHTIFYGKCMAAEPRLDENGLPATRYTFEVQKILKGVLPQTFFIKQFGVNKPLNENLPVSSVGGMPNYVVGDSYLLFMTEVSRLGFSSPQGLNQGAFRTFLDTSSRQIVAVNGQGNSGLFDGVKIRTGSRLREAAPDSGEYHPLLLEDLMRLVQQVLESK